MSKRLAALTAASLTATAIIAACSSSPPPSPPGTPTDAGDQDTSHAACTPGESTPCICAGGGFGTVVCVEAGTNYGTCSGCPGSSPDASPPTDAAPPDASSDSASAPTDASAPSDAGPLPASLVFAHAAPGVPPVRLCFSTSTGATPPSVPPIRAIPDLPSTAPAVPALGSFPAVPQGTPGLYPGTITALPVLLDLSSLNLTLLAVLSSSIPADLDLDGGPGLSPDGGAEETCLTLVGPHGLGTLDSPPGRLVLGADFFPLPSIPAGTLQTSTTYLLSLTGCLAGAVSTGAATCGAGYDGGTSAEVGVAQLDTTTTVSASLLGAQFAHRSSAIEGTSDTQGGTTHGPASAGLVPMFYAAGPDGGMGFVPLEASQPIVTFSATGIAPSPAGTYAIDPTSASTLFGVLLEPTGGGAPNPQPYPAGDFLAMPLSTIQVLSDWRASTASAPSAFATGVAYTFLLVGDPAAPPLTLSPGDGGPATLNPAYDGRGLHFVAFPNQFTPKSY